MKRPVLEPPQVGAEKPPATDPAALIASSPAWAQALQLSSHELSVVLDESGRVRHCGVSVRWILGRSIEELMGRDLRSLIHDEDRERFREARERAWSAAGSPLRTHFRALHADGGWRFLEASARTVELEGFRGVVLNAVDASRRHLLESQLHQAMKLEAIGRFTGGIAHDFNNLLTVVLVNLDLAEEGLEQGDERAELLRSARAAAGRGQGMIQHLLAFARRQEMQAEALDIEQLVADMDGLFAASLDERVELSSSFQAGLPSVLADRTRLESALLNLVVNARDAMPDGGALTIAASCCPPEDLPAPECGESDLRDAVRIEVRDNGVGMTPDVLTKACRPFFSTKDTASGTGLGLSMVASFVKECGGRLRVASEPGRGTSVTLYLPRSTPRDRAATSSGPR